MIVEDLEFSRTKPQFSKYYLRLYNSERLGILSVMEGWGGAKGLEGICVSGWV